jgi:hypothetical protein
MGEKNTAQKTAPRSKASIPIPIHLSKVLAGCHPGDGKRFGKNLVWISNHVRVIIPIMAKPLTAKSILFSACSGDIVEVDMLLAPGIEITPANLGCQIID